MRVEYLVVVVLWTLIPNYSYSQGEEYASWMAGCRMVMKGRPLARSGYDQELSSIRAFVAMQNKADTGSSSASADSVRGEIETSGIFNLVVVGHYLEYHHPSFPTGGTQAGGFDWLQTSEEEKTQRGTVCVVL